MCEAIGPRGNGPLSHADQPHTAEITGRVGLVDLLRPNESSNLQELLVYMPIQTNRTYLSLRAVTLSGSCGPLCSSPTTTGIIMFGLICRISCPFSGREKSNCLMSVAKNVRISMTLVRNKISRSARLLYQHPTAKQRLDTHVNLHAMQLLRPPEKVRLHQESQLTG